MNDLLERMSTGNPQLDRILGGGIPLFSVNAICGAPGTGKTVLTQQIMFHNATPEQKALYLTTLSEPTLKVLRYQQRFSYFDAEKVGTAVFFHDIGKTIRDEGLERTLEVITGYVRQYRPHFVAVDSFKAIHDLAVTPQEMRRFVYDLAVRMAGWQCTTFLVGEYSEEQFEQEPEFAVADGVLRLGYRVTPEGSYRFLQVLKMRGTEFLEGEHFCRITPHGLEVFPSRLPPVRPLGLPPQAPLPLGLPELDALLGGGIPPASHLLVAGPPGAGKTLLSLAFLLHGLEQQGEKGVLFLVGESPEQLAATMAQVGWDLRKYQRLGLHVEHCPFTALEVDPFLYRILQVIEEHEPQRVVIDSLSSLFPGLRFQGARFYDRLAQLSEALRVFGCTTLSTLRTQPGQEHLRDAVEEALLDGVILLDLRASGPRRRRVIEVYKLRGGKPTLGEYRFQITPQGLKVLYIPGTEPATEGREVFDAS